MVEDRYLQRLSALQQQQRYRSLTDLASSDEPGFVTSLASKQKMLNLSSNDYLGLSCDQTLLDEFYQKRMKNEPAGLRLGSASSRLLTGSSNYTRKLEVELGEKYGKSSLLFNSGYHANIGILPALTEKKDLIISDKLNHASIHDGMRLSSAKHKRFNHCDYDHLEFLLKKEWKNVSQIIVVTESVFSMDGDCADLKKLVQLKKKYNFLLYVDEAHGVGLYGQGGLGKAEEYGVLDQIDLLVGTFGKAFGSVGAFLICSSTIREYLINFSRSFIFTTALPPVVINWNRFILEKLADMDQKRQELQKLSSQLRAELVKEGLQTAGLTNIVPVIIGDVDKTVEVAKKLQQSGFLTLPVRPPTVPEGGTRFRLSLTVGMDWQQLSGVARCIAKFVEQS